MLTQKKRDTFSDEIPTMTGYPISIDTDEMAILFQYATHPTDDKHAQE